MDDEDSELDEISFFTVGESLIHGIPVEQVRELIYGSKDASKKSKRQNTSSIIEDRVEKLLSHLSAISEGKKNMLLKILNFFTFI